MSDLFERNQVNSSELSLEKLYYPAENSYKVISFSGIFCGIEEVTVCCWYRIFNIELVLAAEPGFEPGQKDSKSFVLPLHNSANRFVL